MYTLKEPLKLEKHHFRVEGMHCIKCVRKIQSIGAEIHSIKELNVHLGEHLVVTTVEAGFKIANFMKKVKTSGFSIKALPKSNENNTIKKEQQSLLMRIGVAGFCAGNIMLLSSAEYLGATLHGWPKLFKFFELICFLPVIFYSAVPLYTTAWSAIKTKHTSIDSPIVLALIGGTVLSIYNLYFLNGPIYFDSLAMFVFFLMASRFVVHKIQNKYVSGISTKDIYNQTYIQKYSGNSIETVNIKDVNVGDKVLILKNAFVPFDSILVSSSTVVDDSLYTGEFVPALIRESEKIFAGCKNIGADITVKVIKIAKESRLSSLIENLNISLLAKTSLQSLADKGAQYLTYMILLIAGALLAYFSFFDLEEGLNRTLALLVVACPCGLAIAAPLIQTLAVKRSLKNGLLVKDVSVFEAMSKVESVVFDKTGTLTLAKMKVQSCKPRELTENEKDIIYNLEFASEHPVAKALKSYTGVRNHVSLKNIKEIIGVGVQGYFQKDFYEITFDKKFKGNIIFLKNNIQQVTFRVEDKVDENSREIVKYLRGLGLESYILSGDVEIKAQDVAKQVLINSANVHSRQTPESKKRFIESHKNNVLYIGDGVNDSLAMSKSLVSVSMSSAADIAFKSTKVHILKGGVEKLRALFSISKISVRALKSIILISLIYNIVFALIASLGFISPLVAVVIMPLSSITITFLGYWLIAKKIEGLK